MRNGGRRRGTASSHSGGCDAHADTVPAPRRGATAQGGDTSRRSSTPPSPCSRRGRSASSTVEDVMEVAGLSRTAFYRYFPDLESVVLRQMGAHRPTSCRTPPRTGSGRRIPTPSWSARGGASPPSTGTTAVLMQAFSEAAGAGPDVQRTWRATIDCLIEPGVAHLGCSSPRGGPTASVLTRPSGPCRCSSTATCSTSTGRSADGRHRRARGGAGADLAADAAVALRSASAAAGGGAGARGAGANQEKSALGVPSLELEVGRGRAGDLERGGGGPDVHPGEPREERVVMAEGDACRAGAAAPARA